MCEMVPELTPGEFEEFLKEGVALVNFFAEGHMSCLMMDPIIEDLHEEFADKIKIGKFNVEENTIISRRFNINSFPTFIIFREGEIREILSGTMTQDELGEVIQRHLE